MNKNYFDLYLKYKKKYLNLKDTIYYQLGSASKNDEVCQLDSLNMVSVTRFTDFNIDQVDYLCMNFFEKLFEIFNNEKQNLILDGKNIKYLKFSDVSNQIKDMTNKVFEDYTEPKLDILGFNGLNSYERLKNYARFINPDVSFTDDNLAYDIFTEDLSVYDYEEPLDKSFLDLILTSIKNKLFNNDVSESLNFDEYDNYSLKINDLVGKTFNLFKQVLALEEHKYHFSHPDNSNNRVILTYKDNDSKLQMFVTKFNVVYKGEEKIFIENMYIHRCGRSELLKLIKPDLYQSSGALIVQCKSIQHFNPDYIFNQPLQSIDRTFQRLVDNNIIEDMSNVVDGPKTFIIDRINDEFKFRLSDLPTAFFKALK